MTPVIAAAQLITALQTIVSRNVEPTDPAVVSITQVHSGNTWNAIPEIVDLKGTCRYFNPATGTLIEERIKKIVENICTSFNVSANIVFNPENPGYPVTINTPAEAQISANVAAEIVGSNNVDLQPTPSLGTCTK